MDGFLMENPIKMDDLGVPLFSETSKTHPKLQGVHLRFRAWTVFFLVDAGGMHWMVGWLSCAGFFI